MPLPLLPWAGGCSGGARRSCPGEGVWLAVPPLRLEAAPAENAWVPKILPESVALGTWASLPFLLLAGGWVSAGAYRRAPC